ncbi:MAG: cytochrome P450, partial [Gordonia polyisoprenivorans]|nr:cytochrome P450 [Gordonia polyisoprenivorans]
LESEDLRALGQLREFYDRWMVFSDDPYHETVRRCVQRILTPRAVEERRSRIAREIRALAERSLNESTDLYHDWARPIAVRVICDLLDIPVSLWDEFSRWSADLIAFISSTNPDPVLGAAALQSYRHCVEYVRDAARRLGDQGRRSNPIMAVAELGEPAMVATFAQFLTGGCDPIAAGIGNALASLMAHPEQAARLQSDPTLVKSGIEECVRFETPFTQIPKVARRDTSIGGTEITAGAQVRFMISAANRDPEVFSEPNGFDLGREPNPHLGYGKGPHYCIGAGLARVELGEVLACLASSDVTCEAYGPPTWLDSFGLRSVISMPGRLIVG